MELIEFKDIAYPAFTAQGNAAQFAIPYAKHFCKGIGVDVGYKEEEWKFPGAIGIDLEKTPPYHAGYIPHDNLDYIFSSHCLEHIPDWIDIMDYWYDKLKVGGVLFLYLPHYDQEYWRPWNNRKHVNIFTSEIIEDYMRDKGYSFVMTSEIDLNYSFMVVGEKCERHNG